MSSNTIWNLSTVGHFSAVCTVPSNIVRNTVTTSHCIIQLSIPKLQPETHQPQVTLCGNNVSCHSPLHSLLGPPLKTNKNNSNSTRCHTSNNSPIPPIFFFLITNNPPLPPPTHPPQKNNNNTTSTTHTKQPNSSDLEVAGDRDGDCSLSPMVTLVMWPGPQRSAQLRQRILRNAIDAECSNPRAVHVVVKLQTVLRAAGIVVHLKHATTCQQKFFRNFPTPLFFFFFFFTSKSSEINNRWLSI